jgi:hypothetical protein
LHRANCRFDRVRFFHYHLATSRPREHEERYLTELGFALVARYGTLAGEPIAAGPDRGWSELDELGFRLRLTELERDGVNVVVQPGRWEPPLVDHVGVFASETEVEAVLGRGRAAGRTVQERNGRRTFVATGVGYRIELRSELDVAVAPFEVTLAAAEPGAAAAALGLLLDVEPERDELRLGSGRVRFQPGGPSGRPRFVGERIGD